MMGHLHGRFTRMESVFLLTSQVIPGAIACRCLPGNRPRCRWPGWDTWAPQGLRQWIHPRRFLGAPIGEEDQFTQTPWRLPDSYICFSPPAAAVEAGPLPALSNGNVTFGCFNNLSKVTDRVVACWAQLLQAVPESRLFLKSKALGESEVRKAVADRFARDGVSADRLLMEGQQASHQEHFRAYQRVDIALDPFPYPGITTTVEGLWMGVPTMALRGDRFLSHQGESILNNAGLPDWVANDEDEYVAKAAAFARDLEKLTTLRAKLRDQVRASPLFDAPRFARNLEQAFREMWRKWCEQQKLPKVAN